MSRTYTIGIAIGSCSHQTYQPATVVAPSCPLVVAMGDGEIAPPWDSKQLRFTHKGPILSSWGDQMQRSLQCQRARIGRFLNDFDVGKVTVHCTVAVISSGSHEQGMFSFQHTAILFAWLSPYHSWSHEGSDGTGDSLLAEGIVPRSSPRQVHYLVKICHESNIFLVHYHRFNMI